MAGPTKTLLTKAGGEPRNLEEQIRLHAYQLYEARGREDGRDLDDWLRAEEEITQKTSRTFAA